MPRPQRNEFKDELRALQQKLMEATSILSKEEVARLGGENQLGTTS